MAKLYFKFGAMKCGKTTDIIKTYYNYKEKGMTFANRTLELYNFLLGGGLFNS